MATKDIELNKDYWDNFYRNNVIDIPSQFCVYMATDIAAGSSVAEFGCGNGRDALYLASQGFNVRAVDLSAGAVESCQAKLDARGIQHAQFKQGDLSCDDDIANTLDNARQACKEDSQVVVYSRFVMHSLDKSQESAFLVSLGKHMQAGETVYFEFRSQEDAELEKTFGGHYRRYVNTDLFLNELNDNGFDIRYHYTGQGMSVYKNEDPFVSRIVAIRR